MPASPVPVLPVADLDTARRFYVHTLGCLPATLDPGRSTSRSPRLDLELCGQSLTLCRHAEADSSATATATFVLGVDDWCLLSERLRTHGLTPEIEPGRRFSAIPGEQCAMRLADPDGNLLEFRGFAREADLFAA